jgi:hypothetical protein
MRYRQASFRLITCGCNWGIGDEKAHGQDSTDRGYQLAGGQIALAVGIPVNKLAGVEFLHFGPNGTVYGAKLWSACSLLPLFHQPARWLALVLAGNECEWRSRRGWRFPQESLR